jgi:hypothetical protein
MKTLYNIFIILFITGLLTSCTDEKVIDVNPDFTLSFQRDGQATAFAGTTFYVLRSGSGEFLSLYDGTTGHVWGEPSATGTFFSKNDSLGVNYSKAGKYNLTVISSSSESYGDKLNRLVKTVEVTVIDRRNSITGFSATTPLGVFNGNITGNTIEISVPDVMTDYNFVSAFTLSSDAAKVYVGTTTQVSGETSNNFSSPIAYRVVADNGDESIYNVNVVTFPASDERALLKFQLASYDRSIGYTNSNGEVASIDEVNKTINLKVNYGTAARVRLVASSSDLSTVYIQTATANNRLNTQTNYTLSSIVSVQVEAQNKQRSIYSLVIEDEEPILSFSFKGLNPAPQGIIDNTNRTVTINVLEGTDITKLAAEWKGSVGDVRVTGVSQVNGETVNDFSSPLTYSFYKGSAVGITYTVTVNVK